jgi:hypothetical protein
MKFEKFFRRTQLNLFFCKLILILFFLACKNSKTADKFLSLYVQYKLNYFGRQPAMTVSKTLYKDIEKVLINPKIIYTKSELGIY